MRNEYSIIITTCPDKGMAKSIAKLLVESRLAACVQTLPIESVYIWQGKICDENEIMMIIKSKAELFDKIVAVIREHHTYEVPEYLKCREPLWRIDEWVEK